MKAIARLSLGAKQLISKEGFAQLTQPDGMRRAGLRRDAIRSQVIDALEAQEIKETGNEED